MSQVEDNKTIATQALFVKGDSGNFGGLGDGSLASLAGR